jgi:phosphate transport system substrate-binding protein
MRKLSIALASLVAMLVVTSAQARDQIKIVGSSTVFPYATIVAERFGSSGKFKTPVIESTGTGGGAKLFCAGVGTEHPDITNASRAMKAKEYALCQKNGVEEIVEITVGNDGITLAYSKDAKPVNFTKKHLWAALAKEVAKDGALVPNPYKNWSDIDSSLPNYPIKVMVPPGTSETRLRPVSCRQLSRFEAVHFGDAGPPRLGTRYNHQGGFGEPGHVASLVPLDITGALTGWGNTERFKPRGQKAL